MNLVHKWQKSFFSQRVWYCSCPIFWSLSQKISIVFVSFGQSKSPDIFQVFLSHRHSATHKVPCPLTILDVTPKLAQAFERLFSLPLNKSYTRSNLIKCSGKGLQGGAITPRQLLEEVYWIKNRAALQKPFNLCISSHAISVSAIQQLTSVISSACHPNHGPLPGEIVSTHTVICPYQHPRVYIKWQR